jgi:fatty acid desaturase
MQARGREATTHATQPTVDSWPETPDGARLPSEVLRPLQEVSATRSLASLTGTWTLILASLAAALSFPHPLVWVAAILMIGRCQHALAVLMHDAAHFRLFRSRRWNDLVGQWVCAVPIASNLFAYRTVHLRHHKYLLTERDPDLSLSLPFPCGRASWWRKLFRDATGISALVMRGYLTVDRDTGRMRLSTGNLLRRWSLPTAARRALGLAGVLALAWAGYLTHFFLLWVVPLLTVYQVILRIRGVLEHAAVPDHRDPLRNARTVISKNPLARFFLAPHHVSYHLEHHLYPGVPHYHLPALHRALRARSSFERAYIETSYQQALRRVVGESAMAGPRG